MSFNNIFPDKIYFSIGEVSEMFEVNASMIRYWEKEFDILKPAKNKKGNRLFTRQDLENIKIIYHLVKERGFTLQGAKDKLSSNKEDVVKSKEVTESLEKIKKFLIEIKNEL